MATIMSGLLMPRIIYVARKKKLFDLPDNFRKIHKDVVPNLGGIGIFFAYIIISALFSRPIANISWNYIMAASLMLFLIGIKDDIVGLSPSKKFLAQLIASVLIVYYADIRLVSLHGILGVHTLPYWISIAFSIVGCIFVTNAFNLIDGIDGLAGSISMLCTLTLGIALAFQGNFNAACMAFALMGGILGFMRYNIAPAKIFMGDSGSLFIGFTISILCIKFINSFSPDAIFGKVVHSPKGALIIALSILFIPVFDSFRVFITRIAKGHHPFSADRTHLHHYLLDLGFSHSKIVTILITANLLIISVSLLVQDYNPNIAIAAIVSLTFGLFVILFFMRKTRLAKTGIPTLAPVQAESPESLIYNNTVIKPGNGKKMEMETPVHTIAGERS
jgi:UDP-GlcNAc:undecaprenyl-phosphate GlcNAc-1-phosphate transferase